MKLKRQLSITLIIFILTNSFFALIGSNPVQASSPYVWAKYPAYSKAQYGYGVYNTAYDLYYPVYSHSEFSFDRDTGYFRAKGPMTHGGGYVLDNCNDNGNCGKVITSHRSYYGTYQDQPVWAKQVDATPTYVTSYNSTQYPDNGAREENGKVFWYEKLSTPMHVWEKFNLTTTQEYQLIETSTVINSDYGWRTVYPSATVDKITGAVTLLGTPYESNYGSGYYFVGSNSVKRRWTTTNSCSNYPGCYEEVHGYSIYQSRLVPVETKGSSTGEFVVSPQSNTYPRNGKHSDGYWYVYLGANGKPLLSINNSGNIAIGKTQNVILEGFIVDPEGDDVVISAQIDGITKSQTITNAATSKPWQLVWNGSELKEGTYINPSISARDSKGNSDMKAYNGTIIVDKTGPALPTISLSPTGWTNQNVQVSITPGSDTTTGISKTEYRIGNGVWQTYTSPFSVQTEGVTSIKARSTDYVGNIGGEAVAETRIVKSPPTVPVITLQTGAWSNEAVTFNISGSTGYGDFYYEYRLGDGSYQRASSGNVNKEGLTSVTARAVNAFGQSSVETTASIKIDKTAPEITITPNGRNWSSDSINVNVTITDELSGVKPNGVYYKVTQSSLEPTDWEIFNGSEIKISEEGQWFIHVRATDNAGNTIVRSSNPLKVQNIPIEPTNVRSTNVQNDQVTIQWDLPAGTVYTDGYSYDVRNTVTGATYQINYPENAITEQVLGGRLYEYIVSVKNHVGQAEAQSLTVLTKPDGPEHLQVQKVDRDYSRAYLSFASSVGAESYRVNVRNSSGDNVLDEIIYSNNYMIDNLQAGTVYNISVRGINASGEGPENSISYLSLPDVPGGFTDVNIEESAIALKWNSVTSATYYGLDRFNELIYRGPEIEFKDIGLEAGTFYDYRVVAVNDTGAGDYAELPNLITLPAKPLNVQITTATSNSAMVQWSSVHGADSYIVESSNGDRVKVNTTQHTFEGLEPGNEYEISVTPENRSGQGKSINTTAVTIPNQPDGIQVHSIEETAAEITWNPTPGADKYIVRIDGSEYEVSGTSLQLNSLAGSKTYQFTISAGNVSGYGEAAAGEFLTKPHAPSNVTVEMVSMDAIKIRWESDETAIGYKAKITDSIDVADLLVNEVTFNELEPGKTYTFETYTINSSGESVPAQLSVTTKTLPVNPDSIIVKVEEEQVIIEFNPVENGKDHVLIDKDGSEVWRGTEGPITIIPIIPGNEYEYDLIVENEQGRPSDPTEVTFITIPSSPEGIAVQKIDDESITFDISSVNKKGTEVIVVYRDGEKIDEIDLNKNDSYTNKNLESGKEYSYEFKAQNESGISSDGVTIDVQTVPAAPDGIKVKSVTETTVTFDFSIVDATGSESIQINRNGEELATIETDKIEYIDQNLKEGTNYKYEFIAINNSGSSKAAVIEVKTKTRPVISGGGGSEGSLGGSNGSTDKDPNNQGGKNPDDDIDKPLPESNSTFKDIDDSFAKDQIIELANLGIIKGKSESKFEPRLPITRMEFVSMIVRALGLESTGKKEVPFRDINLNRWYGDEFLAAWDNEVAHGFSSTMFKPNALINREQASKMLGNILQTKKDANLVPFVDGNEISKWALGEVLGLTEKDLISGYPDGTFRPKSNLTRAESAVLIFKTISASN